MLRRNGPPLIVAIAGAALVVGLLALSAERATPVSSPDCPPDMNSTGSIVPVCEVFVPIVDTYVDQMDRRQRFDSSEELRAGASSRLTSYLRFDASRIGGEINRATLWLYAYASVDSVFELYGLTGGELGEDGTPSEESPITESEVKVSFTVKNAGWTMIDVTPHFAGSTVVNLAVTSPTPDAVRIASSESGDRAPRLIVEIDPVLLAAGDIAHCVYNRRGAYITGQMLDNLRGTIAVLGDLAYDNGSPSEFRECYDPAWGRHKARTRPSLGNHEYGLGTAFGYFDYFGDLAGDPDRGYYSYNLGSWHVVVINSNCRQIGGCGIGSPQERWLRDDLAAYPAMCTVAYWHDARFSSGVEGSSPMMEAIWQALYDADADLILSAHAHSYERFAPQTPDGSRDLQRGVRQFVVGTGGAPLAPFDTILPNSEVRQTDLNGLLKVRLRANSYDWEFLSEPGKSFRDSGSARCH